jgi:hypothetical protein
MRELFHTLREHLTLPLVLAHPNMFKPFEVYCDASGTDLSCFLMQENQVIAPMPHGHFDFMK